MQVRFPPRLQILLSGCIWPTSNLKYKPTIQKTIAIFLVLVFFMSIAPKAYFHNLAANHKDFSDCHQLHHSTVLHQQGINCHFDDLVVSSPFFSACEFPIVIVHISFEKRQSAVPSLCLSSFSQHKENRGPPVA
jgi:hypothetical protein